MDSGLKLFQFFDKEITEGRSEFTGKSNKEADGRIHLSIRSGLLTLDVYIKSTDVAPKPGGVASKVGELEVKVSTGDGKPVTDAEKPGAVGAVATPGSEP